MQVILCWQIEWYAGDIKLANRMVIILANGLQVILCWQIEWSAGDIKLADRMVCR
jgi:hypothetical protein